MSEKIMIGQILRAHGIKGELRIFPLTDSPEDFCLIKKIYLNDVAYDIQFARPALDNVLLKIRGIDSRDSAIALKGDLYALRQDLPEKSDRFYVADIIGFAVISDGINLGFLSDILNFGTKVDTYFVESKNGNFSFPALQEVIEKIDIESKIIILNLNELEKVRVYEI